MAGDDAMARGSAGSGPAAAKPGLLLPELPLDCLPLPRSRTPTIGALMALMTFFSTPGLMATLAVRFALSCSLSSSLSVSLPWPGALRPLEKGCGSGSGGRQNGPLFKEWKRWRAKS